MHRPDYLALGLYTILYLVILNNMRPAFEWHHLVGSSIVILGPAYAWSMKNYLLYGTFGMTLALSGVLIFNTYGALETGRTPDNAVAVDQMMSAMKKRLKSKPNAIFPASRVKPDGSPRTFDERLSFWQDLNDATIRAAFNAPSYYLHRVGDAVIGMLHPSLGRMQAHRFFNMNENVWRYYRYLHFGVFGFRGTALVVYTIRTLFRQPTIAEMLPVFLLGLFSSHYFITCLLISGANNRFRMPFDGLLLLAGILSLYRLRKTDS